MSILKIIELNDSIMLEVKNEYSKLRYTKSDIKLNIKRKKQFVLMNKFISFADKLENKKVPIFLKNPFKKYKNKLIKSNKYETLQRCFTDNSINIEYENYEKKEVIPESIIIYDLLPKEYVGEFSKKYIKFKDNASDTNIFILGKKSIKQIRDSFNKIGTRFSVSSYKNVDFFVFDKKHYLSKIFKNISVFTTDISPSFSSISYKLELSEEMIYMFDKLSTSKVYREGHFIDNGNKDKKNYSFSMGGTNLFTKAQTIEDYFCEIKFEFLKFLKKELMSKLDDLNVVLPSVTIYKTENLSTLIKNRNKLHSIGIKTLDLHYNSAYETNIEIPKHSFDSNEKYNIINVLVDSKSYDKNEYSSKVNEVYNSLVYGFCDYYILGSLLPEYDKRISKTNEKINLMLQRKSKNYGSLIKLRKKTLNDFNLFDRLLDELFKKETNTHEFNLHGERDYVPIESVGSVDTYSKKKEILKWRLDVSSDGISQINDFFEYQLKTVESYSNFKIVKISLWVAFLSLLVAILALILSNQSIMDWIDNFLKNSPPQ